MAFAHAIGSYPYWCVVMFLCERAQTPNAITKRYQQTLPLMGATRPASGIKVKVHTPNKGSQAALIIRLSVRAFAFMPARRVALSLQQLSGAAANLQTLLNRTL